MEVVKHEEGFEKLETNPNISRKVVHLKDLMFTVIEFSNGPMKEPDPPHNHPHEQGGVMLEGKMKFTIDGESRIVEPGESFIIPGNVPHRAEAIDGPCVALDIFSPIREDYVELANRYIPSEDK